MFVGNLEAKLTPCVLGRLRKGGIKAGCCMEFANPLPASSRAAPLTVGPLGRFWQGEKKKEDMVEEINKSIQGVARMEKKIKGYKRCRANGEGRTS